VFRGIIGEGMRAPLVRMPVRLNDEVLSDDDNMSVMFAVCDELNESCILSIPTVNMLNDVLNKKLLSTYNDINIHNNDMNQYVLTLLLLQVNLNVHPQSY